MYSTLMKLFGSLHEFFRSHEIIYSLFATILLLSVFFVVIYFFEARRGADKKRYLSKNFAIDLAYNLFYRGGLFTFFIYAPIMSILQPRLTIFDAHLVTYLDRKSTRLNSSHSSISYAVF